MAKPMFDLCDAFEGDLDGSCYPALLARVDAIIQVMCPDGVKPAVADAIRRHAIRETDPEWAEFVWPGDRALDRKPWAKMIAACAAHAAPQAKKPGFGMTPLDAAILLSPNVFRLPTSKRH